MNLAWPSPLRSLVLGTVMGGASLAGCVHAPPGQDEGRLGLRYRALPEGLIITDVLPGTGAADAGLVVGDCIVGIENRAVHDLADPHPLLVGAVGTSIHLQVEGAIDRAKRDVVAVRGVLAAAPTLPPVEPAIADLRDALDDGNVRQATRAAQALTRSSVEPASVARALRAPLFRASNQHPDAVLAIAPILSTGLKADPDVHGLLAMALLQSQQTDLALHEIDLAEAHRPPDIRGQGWTADIGGAGRLRAEQARWTWLAGERENALAMIRPMLPWLDDSDLLQLMGVAAPQWTEWRAPATPMASIDLQTLDGQPWSLAALHGQVVVLVFWATWCEPCREELPHIVELAHRPEMNDAHFLLVSVDAPNKSEAVRQFAAQQHLSLPVAQAGREDQFELDSIPAVRVVSRGGVLAYSAHGYSPEGVLRLADVITSELARPDTADTTLGAVQGEAGQLASFVALPNVDATTMGEGDLWVAIGPHAPTRLHQGELDVGALVPDRAGADVLGWLDGPVGGVHDEPWLRAWDDEGSSRWLLTLPAGLVTLEASDTTLWALLDDGEALAIDTKGHVNARRNEHHYDALAISPDGSALAVGEGQVWSLGLDSATKVGDAPYASTIDSAGAVGTPSVRSLVTGRFGPDGALRTVAQRSDGWLFGLTAEGAATFVWQLPTDSRVALARSPDGPDHLLVTIPGTGIATLALELP